jgi:hypothetical protein
MTFTVPLVKKEALPLGLLSLEQISFIRFDSIETEKAA